MRHILPGICTVALMISCGDKDRAPSPGEGSKPSPAEAGQEPIAAASGETVSTELTPNGPVVLQAKPQLNAELQSALDAFTAKSPELRGVLIDGYTWNIKAALIKREGDAVRVQGQLSHALPMTLDDQVYFDLRLAAGVIESFEIRYQERNWVALVELILPIADKLVKLPLPLAELSDISERLETIVYRDWQAQAKVIILKLSNLAL